MSYEVMHACSSSAVYLICYLYSTKQYIRDLKLNTGNTTFKMIQNLYLYSVLAVLSHHVCTGVSPFNLARLW